MQCPSALLNVSLQSHSVIFLAVWCHSVPCQSVRCRVISCNPVTSFREIPYITPHHFVPYHCASPSRHSVSSSASYHHSIVVCLLHHHCHHHYHHATHHATSFRVTPSRVTPFRAIPCRVMMILGFWCAPTEYVIWRPSRAVSHHPVSHHIIPC